MSTLHEDLLHPFVSYPFQQTYIETLQDLQDKIDECKEDPHELYEEFNNLANTKSSTHRIVEMVRATNIGPLDSVTEQKQMSTIYIEPDLFILTNLTTPMTSELEPDFAHNPSIFANIDLDTTYTISCLVSDKSRLENK